MDLVTNHWSQDAETVAQRFRSPSEDGQSYEPCTLVLAFIVGHDFTPDAFFSERERIFSLFGTLLSQGHHVGLQLYQASDRTLIGQMWSGGDPPANYVQNEHWYKEKYDATWINFGS